MKKFFLRFWPLFFLLMIWMFFAYPYFFQGKVPYASTYQGNFFPPWSHYEQFWGPVKNNAMPDVHGQIYPWKKFTIETYKNGEIPFWNPYGFSGNPHLANVQSGVLSPFNLLFFVLPFIDAWSVLILLQPLLAGVFMYLFMRTLAISKIGSLIGSIAFMFCGFIVVWMAYGTLAFAILFLPLALFCIEKYFEAKKLRFLLLLMLTIPFSFFSGHFQISLYFLTAVAGYILFKGIATKNIHNTIYIILATVLGLTLSLPQLLLSIELYRHAVRSELFQLSEAIPLQYFITIIVPDFFGNPVTRNDWFGHYAEWAGFIGIVPFILALYAMVRKKTPVVWFFAILGISALVFAVKTPLSAAIVGLKIPVISTSAFSRIIVLFSFSFAVLSGLGLDQLQKEKKDTRLNILLAIIALVFGILWFVVLFTNAYPKEWLIVAKRNFVLPTVFFILTAASLLSGKFRPKMLLFFTCFLLFITSFDSLRYAQKWMPFDPRHLVYPDVPIILAMKEHIGDGRIFGNLGAEVGAYYGLPLIEGYDPLYIGRYGEFLRSASKGEFVKAERSVAKIDRNGKYIDRVLDLLGVTLVFQPIADTNQGWAYPVWDKKDRYGLIYKDDKFELYKNNKALPRAALFYKVEVIKEPRALLTRFYSDDFDFREKLLLEEDLGLATSKNATGSTEILSYTSDKIVIQVKTDQSALVFLADNFYPGWKATVNGKPARIYRADYTFRAVPVPAGESKVTFIYSFIL